jgi:hypothetical protein
MLEVVRLFLAYLLAGCAGPFAAVRPEASRGDGLSVGFCGSTKITGERVLRAMEPPSDLPSEVGGSGGLEPPEEARFCLSVDNRGTQTARIDRSYLQLKCPREKQPWVPDSDDQEVIVHGGESKQVHVSFHYSPMVSGEDVTLLLEGAVTVGGKRARLPPLALRKN